MYKINTGIIVPNPGIEPISPVSNIAVRLFTTEPPWTPYLFIHSINSVYM